MKDRIFGGLAALTFLMAWPVAEGASCGPPPTGGPGPGWWSAYKDWCRNSCGGQICDAYNDCSGQCVMPTAPAGAGGNGGGSVGEQLGTMLGNAMADMLACQWFNRNCPPGMQKNQDNPAVRAQYNSMNQDRQALVDQADAEQAEAARRSGDRIRAALSGGSDGLQARDLSAPAELQVEEVQGAMGSKEVKPIFMKPRKGAIYATASLGPLKQLRCADALMKKAEDFSNTLSTYERYSASEAASDYLSGAPATLACANSDLAPLADVPTPAAVAVQSKQVLVKSKLFSRTVQQQGNIATLTHDIETAKENEKRAAEAKKQHEEEVKALSKDSDRNPEDPAKKSAMAEALRALAESNRVLKENQALITQKEAEKAKDQKDLVRTTDLYAKAVKTPDAADDILSQIQ